MTLVSLSGNSLGYYVYVEASLGKNFNLASLDGPVLQQAAATCYLTFWYHMYGSNIGELVVYIKSGLILTPLWKLSGNQGKDILLKLANIKYMIEFVAFKNLLMHAVFCTSENSLKTQLQNSQKSISNKYSIVHCYNYSFYLHTFAYLLTYLSYFPRQQMATSHRLYLPTT